MNEERYCDKCKDCPNWKYMCWVLAPGTVQQTKKCDIYLAHQKQVSNNWASLGVANR